MASATTTTKLIRAQQISLLQALAPASLAKTKLREYERSEDFREWAESKPDSCFRRFTIEDVGAYEPALASDTISEEVVTIIRLTVAYPIDTRYGKGGDSDLRDTATEDMHQINTAIGMRGIANYASGQNGSIENETTLDEEESVLFLTVDYETNYRRSI